MKLKFGMIGNDETRIKVSVEIATNKHVLTRDEARRLKEKLKDEVHDLLRNQKYSVSQIRASR